MRVIFLSILFCVVYYIFFIKPIFYRKKYNVALDKRNKKIRIKGDFSHEKSHRGTVPVDYSIEQADYNYYNDINEEFNLRRQLYETVHSFTDNTEQINETDFYLPYNLIYELDNQNVHDTFVQKDTQRIYSQAQNSVVPQGEPDFSRLEPEVRDIVNKIQKRNSYISNLNNNEYEILKDAMRQAEYNSNIKDNLILQLKDTLNEYGELYCPTGVATRIVSALAIEKPEQMPKDRGTINTEVLAKFSKLQTDNPDLDKQEIRQAVLQDYPAESVESVNGLINEWIDYV